VFIRVFFPGKFKSRFSPRCPFRAIFIGVSTGLKMSKTTRFDIRVAFPWYFHRVEIHWVGYYRGFFDRVSSSVSKMVEMYRVAHRVALSRYALPIPSRQTPQPTNQQTTKEHLYRRRQS
jgi:hypothetical protein